MCSWQKVNFTWYILYRKLLVFFHRGSIEYWQTVSVCSSPEDHLCDPEQFWPPSSLVWTAIAVSYVWGGEKKTKTFYEIHLTRNIRCLNGCPGADGSKPLMPEQTDSRSSFYLSASANRGRNNEHTVSEKVSNTNLRLCWSDLSDCCCEGVAFCTF